VSLEVHHVVDASPDLPDDAPVVVLSNSLGTTLAMWEPQVPALAEHFRVVRYDTRGHGRSPVPPGPYSIDDLADDLLGLLDRVGVEKAHLVGLSLGGMTAMRLAARNPERVDRLVVLCTSALLGPAQGWLDRAATVRAEGTGAVADASLERWYTPAFRAAHPGSVEAARAMVASIPPEGYAACCEAIAAMDLTEDLADITAPTLAIAGADDPSTPPEHLERIAAAVKDGRLLVVPHSAHIASQEQPGAVTRAVLAHLTAG
jgi:3-oxoadipate enol-lactonase